MQSISATRQAGGEVARHVAKYGQPQERVAKAVLIAATPPLMLKAEENPGGVPIGALDGRRKALAANRTQDFLDLASGPFYATGRPVLDGEPYEGSLADFLAEQAALLGHPEVIFCHYDPLLPPLSGATDITAAETRLKDVPGQRYRRLQHGTPTTILPNRS
jgi:pimeloyl-ACP methyl ester carboxylesterase